MEFMDIVWTFYLVIQVLIDIGFIVALIPVIAYGFVYTYGSDERVAKFDEWVIKRPELYQKVFRWMRSEEEETEEE